MKRILPVFIFYSSIFLFLFLFLALPSLAACLGNFQHGCGGTSNDPGAGTCCSGFTCVAPPIVGDTYLDNFCEPISNWTPPNYTTTNGKYFSCGSNGVYNQIFSYGGQVVRNQDNPAPQFCDSFGLLCSSSLGCYQPTQTCAQAYSGGTCSFDCNQTGYVQASQNYQCGNFNEVCCRPQTCNDVSGRCINGAQTSCSSIGMTYNPNASYLDNSCTGLSDTCCQPYSNFGACSVVTGTGTCNASSTPTNTCGSYPGTQSTTKASNQPCNPTTGSQSCTTTFQSYCSNGFVCPSSNGVNNCTTSLTIHVFDDYNHDGSQNGNDFGMSGITVSVSGHGSQSTSNGNTTFSGLTTGGYTITITVPSGYQATTTNPLNYTITTGTPNQTLNFGLTPLYTISGTVFNDLDLNRCYNSSGHGCTYNRTTFEAGGDTPYTNGSHITVSGPVNTAVNANSGNYATSQTLTSGSYTVTYDTGTTPLASGYRFTTQQSYVVTLGDSADNQAGYTCSIGGASDTTNTICTNPNNGSIQGLNFGLSNETAWPISKCSDVRIDTGYSEPIPSTANCNNTAGPYAIMNDPSLCPASAGVLFSGGTNPSYGQGTGASTSQMQVGNASFPESFVPHTPNAIETEYSLVLDTTNNLTTPPTKLSSVCADLSNCNIKNLTGGVYTTTAADGPVTLYTDGDNTLAANYTFVIGDNITITSNILESPGFSAAFISGGDIHVAGNVGESNWNSTTPNLQGLFSADKNFDIDRVAGLTATCNTDGSPLDNKLNIQGSVIVNAVGKGGSIVDSREGCAEDLQCPVVSFGPRPQDILHLPSILKIPLTFWQELNP